MFNCCKAELGIMRPRDIFGTVDRPGRIRGAGADARPRAVLRRTAESRA